jgi:hypothetical protein
MEFIDTIISVVAVLIAVVSAVFNRKKTVVDRTAVLKNIVATAFDAALAHTHGGKNAIPLKEAVFKAAVLLDLKDNGKRDFTDAAIMQGVMAEGRQRGVW